MGTELTQKQKDTILKIDEHLKIPFYEQTPEGASKFGIKGVYNLTKGKDDTIILSAFDEAFPDIKENHPTLQKNSKTLLTESIDKIESYHNQLLDPDLPAHEKENLSNKLKKELKENVNQFISEIQDINNPKAPKKEEIRLFTCTIVNMMMFAAENERFKEQGIYNNAYNVRKDIEKEIKFLNMPVKQTTDLKKKHSQQQEQRERLKQDFILDTLVDNGEFENIEQKFKKSLKNLAKRYDSEIKEADKNKDTPKQTDMGNWRRFKNFVKRKFNQLFSLKKKSKEDERLIPLLRKSNSKSKITPELKSKVQEIVKNAEQKMQKRPNQPPNNKNKPPSKGISFTPPF